MSDHNSSDIVPQRQEMSVEMVSFRPRSSSRTTEASDYNYLDRAPMDKMLVPTAELGTDSSQHGDSSFRKSLWKDNQPLPVQTRRLLATNHENLYDELLQFDRFKVWETSRQSIWQSSIIMPIVVMKNKKDEDPDCNWQPRTKGFRDLDHPEKVYLLRKALYGLKQAPRAWTTDPPVPKRADHAGCIVLAQKHFWWDLVPLVIACKLDVKEQNCTECLQ
ncbi:hypothetical protein Tco_1548919 [Tanacetum coccineum]